MVIFKNMVLGGIKKDNYKELARRMSEIGWDQTNDMCRHEVIFTIVLVSNTIESSG